MPTYIRPARVDIAGGGNGTGRLVLIAAAVAAAAGMVAFIAAHAVLVAVCATVFATVMGGLAMWFRWLSSPTRLRRDYYPRPMVRVQAATPATAIPAPPRRALATLRRVVSAGRLPATQPPAISAGGPPARRARAIEPARVIPPAPR